MADATNKVAKYRVFNCMQYEVNPRTGQSFNFDENNILSCVKHKTVKRYAYIKHDKDTITELDVAKSQGYYTDADLGKPKNDHWHIVLEVSPALDIATVAKWLSIPENFVEVPKGQGAFIDCVEYLRHSDERQYGNGKYEYEPDEVKSNFDWAVEVERLILRKSKYEKPLSEKEFIKNEVLYHGMSLQEVYENYPTLYMQELTIFKKLRVEYISTLAPMPPVRVNYYIEAPSGYGKDTMAYSVARSLFPNLGDDAYFEIGANKVTFDGYDGEPCIIWSEFRAETFIKTLGGYENVLSTIDVIPKKKKREHKKFGDVRLTNSVNIVTSTQPFETFLKGLIPDDDPSKEQAPRRFPIWVKIREEDFNININTGYLNEATYSDYKSWKNLKGSFAKLAKKLDTREELQKQVEQKLVAPILEAHDVVVESIKGDPFEGLSDDDILKEFEGYGEEISQEDFSEKLHQEYEIYLAEKEADMKKQHLPFEPQYYNFEWWLRTIKKERL